MWTLKKPEPVKLIVGILACDEKAANAAADMIKAKFGRSDLESKIWPFRHTEYYASETGKACQSRPRLYRTVETCAGKYEKFFAQDLYRQKNMG
jgi:hypothetical protein